MCKYSIVNFKNKTGSKGSASISLWNKNAGTKQMLWRWNLKLEMKALGCYIFRQLCVAGCHSKHSHLQTFFYTLNYICQHKNIWDAVTILGVAQMWHIAQACYWEMTVFSRMKQHKRKWTVLTLNQINFLGAENRFTGLMPVIVGCVISLCGLLGNVGVLYSPHSTIRQTANRLVKATSLGALWQRSPSSLSPSPGSSSLDNHIILFKCSEEVATQREPFRHRTSHTQT